MGLREFPAFQPSCDAADPTKPGGVCGWVIDAEYEVWYPTVADAVDGWREQDGWTDAMYLWVCEEHRYSPHDYVRPVPESSANPACDRCGTPDSEHD